MKNGETSMVPNIVLMDIDNTLANMDHRPCKLWDKSCDHNGYGQLNLKGKIVKAHRVAYCEANGLSLEDIEGVEVLHTCDNPPCVEPTHLVAGTHDDNMKDMARKGRSAQGERNFHAVLTEEDVREIRLRYRCGERQKAIAELFGVSRFAIKHIVLGNSWRHVS